MNIGIITNIGICAVIYLLQLIVLYVYLNSNKEPTFDFNLILGMVVSVIVAVVIAFFSAVQMKSNRNFLKQIKHSMEVQKLEVELKQQDQLNNQQNAYIMIKGWSDFMIGHLQDLKNNNFLSINTKNIIKRSQDIHFPKSSHMTDSINFLTKTDFDRTKELCKNKFKRLKIHIERYTFFIEPHDQISFDMFKEEFDYIFPQILYPNSVNMVNGLIPSLEHLVMSADMRLDYIKGKQELLFNLDENN